MRAAGVRVYIPTLDGGERLEATLSSLRRQTRPASVVVVDNGSTDGSIERTRREFPEVRIVELGRNLGFGSALNRAVAALPADRIVLLNNDVECEPRFLERLQEPLGPGVDVVAGVLVQHAAPSRIDSAGVVVDATLLAFDYLHGEPLHAAAGAAPPLGPTGGAALLRLDAFNAAGGFDERIFAYLEDVDLALRLRGLGLRCALAADARAVHRHASTLGAGSARKNALMGWSRGYLLRRYGVLARPRRAVRALAGEAVVCAGQLAIDGTLTGVRARTQGWRAGAGLERRRLPVEGLDDLSFAESVRRRARRGAAARRAAASARTAGPPVAAPAAAAAGSSPAPRARHVMAVLHLADVSGPARTLAPGLVALSRGGSLSVLLPGSGSAAALFAGHGRVHERHYEPVTLPAGLPDLLRRATALVRDVATIRQQLRADAPDLVVIATATLPSALVASRLEGIPTLVYAAETLAQPGSSVLARTLARALALVTGRLASSIACSSWTVRSQFRWAGPHTTIGTVHPGISERYGEGDGPAFRRRHGIGGDDLCLVIVGNLSAGRGQEIGVRAVAAVVERWPTLRCVIVGTAHPRAADHDYERRLRRLVADLSLEDFVCFVGFSEAVADAYAAADIVINPALVAEGFGRVAMEALMAGVPVIATRVGAVPEVLRSGEHAVLVEPGDPVGLAAAVAELLHDPPRRRKLAAAGRAHVRARYTEERQLERLLELAGGA